MTQMLEGTDGRKMSSSWGNIIAITDEPSDMYGKIMALHDNLIEKYFTLCTKLSLEEIASMQKELANGANPRDSKMRLAREIVALYYGDHEALNAEKNFIETFSRGGVPENIETIKGDPVNLLGDTLIAAKILPSKAQWRRLVLEGAVVNIETNQKVTDPFAATSAGTYRIGKKTFIRIE